MRCLHCGRKLRLIQKLAAGDFCSDEHRRTYHLEQQRLVLDRLADAERKLMAHGAGQLTDNPAGLLRVQLAPRPWSAGSRILPAPIALGPALVSPSFEGVETTRVSLHLRSERLLPVARIERRVNSAIRLRAHARRRVRTRIILPRFEACGVSPAFEAASLTNARIPVCSASAPRLRPVASDVAKCPQKLILPVCAATPAPPVVSAEREFVLLCPPVVPTVVAQSMTAAILKMDAAIEEPVPVLPSPDLSRSRPCLAAHGPLPPSASCGCISTVSPNAAFSEFEWEGRSPQTRLPVGGAQCLSAAAVQTSSFLATPRVAAASLIELARPSSPQIPLSRGVDLALPDPADGSLSCNIPEARALATELRPPSRDSSVMPRAVLTLLAESQPSAGVSQPGGGGEICHAELSAIRRMASLPAHGARPEEFKTQAVPAASGAEAWQEPAPSLPAVLQPALQSFEPASSESLLRLPVPFCPRAGSADFVEPACAFEFSRQPLIPRSRLALESGYKRSDHERPVSLEPEKPEQTPPDPVGRAAAAPLISLPVFAREIPGWSLWIPFAALVLLAFVIRPGKPSHVAAVRKGNLDTVIDQQWRLIRQNILSRAATELQDDFRSGMSDWYGRKNWARQWSYDSAGFVRTGPLILYRPSMDLTDYQMEFLAQIDRKAVGWVFRANDLDNYYAFKIVIQKPGPLPTVATVHYAVIRGKEGPHVESPLPLVVRNDMLYRIRLDVRGGYFTTSIQGQVVDFWADERLARGGVGFFSAKGEQARIRWLEVSHQYDMLGRLCAYLAPYSMPTPDGSWNQ